MRVPGIWKPTGGGSPSHWVNLDEIFVNNELQNWILSFDWSPTTVCRSTDIKVVATTTFNSRDAQASLGVLQTDTYAVVAAHRLISSALRSNDDRD